MSYTGQKFLESLNLQTLVTSRLNPLKICLPLVAKTFASIARFVIFICVKKFFGYALLVSTNEIYSVICNNHSFLPCRIHQIAFCDTIMEHNRRSVLPVEGSMDASRQWTNINPLDSYFPFDPYVLSR